MRPPQVESANRAGRTTCGPPHCTEGQVENPKRARGDVIEPKKHQTGSDGQPRLALLFLSDVTRNAAEVSWYTWMYGRYPTYTLVYICPSL